MKKIITCKFCGRQTCDPSKSHIIPEGFLDCRGFESGKIKQRILRADATSQVTPIGIYDQTILCQECERKQFSCDSYAISIIKPHEGVKLSSIGRKDGFSFSDVNRSQLRRWIASVLWRAHVSSRPEFREVDMGSTLADRIRDELDSDGPFNFVDATIELLSPTIYAAAYGVYEEVAATPKTKWCILAPHIKVEVEIGSNLSSNIPMVSPLCSQLGMPANNISLSESFAKEPWFLVAKNEDHDVLSIIWRAVAAQRYNDVSRKELTKVIKHCLLNHSVSEEELSPDMRELLRCADNEHEEPD